MILTIVVAGFVARCEARSWLDRLEEMVASQQVSTATVLARLDTLSSDASRNTATLTYIDSLLELGIARQESAMIRRDP